MTLAADRAPAQPRASLTVTLLAVSSLTIMASTVISPGLPGMEAHFADEPDAALRTRLAVTLPGLFVALCAPVAGVVVDRIGRRGVLIASILLYALAGMSGLVLDTLTAILVGRAGLGIAVAGVMTAAAALAGDHYHGEARNRFMGRQGSAIGLAGLIFLTGGGLLAETGWRAPFALYGFALLMLPAVLTLIPSSPPHAHGGGAEEPDRPAPRLALALVALIALSNSVIFYVFPVQLPFHLRAMGVGQPSQAGLALGVFTLCSSAAALAVARLRARMSAGALFALAFAGMAAGFAVVAAAGTWAAAAAGAAVAGLGMGLVMPNIFGSALTLSPPRLRGRVSGAMTASVFLGQFLSPMASQPAADAWGYGGAFAAGACALLVLSAACLLARRALTP